MAHNNPVITGYYRYTDIWFDWHALLPDPEDRAPAKAAFAHDSLVHPDHPLHTDGVEGIQMYMGTFHTGESRLLFSSAQVDYVRYWLHAMKLTKNVVPLPYSDCLLTKSELKNVAPVVYKDGGELRFAIKKIDKNNKRLKGANPTLTSRRDTFEKVRSLWAKHSGVWCALDFEAWEREHELITEIGWSLIRWDKEGQEINEHGHYIVSERRKYTNNRYVPEHRYDYNFGTSQFISKRNLEAMISDLLASLSTRGAVFLVFHDNSQDIKYLKQLNAPLEGLSYILPDAIPDEGLFVVDTSDLFGGLEGEPTANRRSLERMCRHLQIPTRNLHNAGNDAHYTVLALKSMAGGTQIDAQREERWPNRTGEATRGVQVEFKPWEEDDDYSDQEGLFPRLANAE